MSAQLEPQFSARPMSAADVDQIAALEQTIYPYPWTWNNFADSLNAGYSCWVYEYAGATVGYSILMITAGEGHLLNLSVVREYQGQGWGRRLLGHVLSLVREHGVINLFLEVRPSNRVARHLYESTGFNEIGMRRAYYPAENGREDAIVMALQL